jgi:hypothetical protein
MKKRDVCTYLEEEVIKIGSKYLQQFESEIYDTYIVELNLENQHIKIPYIRRKKILNNNSIGFTGMKRCNKEESWNCWGFPPGYANKNCKENCSFINLDEENRLYIKWY